MSMKKSILLFFVFVMSLMLCGCSNAPTYSLAQKPDGTVTQTLFIPFVESELTELGVDNDAVTNLKNTIMQKFNTNFANLQQNFITKVNGDDTLSAQDKILMFAGCPTQMITPALSEIGLLYTLTFSSAIHYYYYNSDMNYQELIDYLNQDTSIVENGFLTNRIVNTGTTVYGENTRFSENQTLAEYITSYSTELLRQNTSLTDEQIASVVPTTFVYSYGTTSGKLHSDADRVYHYADGVYYHEWDITTENSARQISTWTIEVNNNVWYVLILCCGFVLLLVLFLIDYKKNKNKEKQMVQ